MVKRTLGILIVLIAAGCSSTLGTRVPGIENFGSAGPDVYRGAQPSAKGIEYLSQHGVRTVVNLRDDARPDEAGQVQRLGMHYVLIRSNAAVSNPDQVARFLEVVRTSPRPIFVHCKAGRDRTGLEVAAYRIAVQGWSRDDAIRELYAYGHNWPLFPNIVKFLRTFEPVPVAPPPPAPVAHVGG
jgi:protein tyrosine/serine phosphatase